jgi:uncharacterized membrane protein YhaH (DUF805 family)
VVLAIIWALPNAWMVSGSWPKRPEARRDADFASSIVARQSSLLHERGDDDKTLLARWLAQQLPPLQTEDDVRIATEKAKKDKASVDPHVLILENESKQILANYEANRQSYRSRVESTIESGLAWWGIPMTCIYLFGLGIAWVRAGFRQPSSQSKPDLSSRLTTAHSVPPAAPPQEVIEPANSSRAGGDAVPPIRRNVNTLASLLAHLFTVPRRLSRSEWLLRVHLTTFAGWLLSFALIRTVEGIWRLFSQSEVLLLSPHSNAPWFLILPPLLPLAYVIYMFFALSLSRLHDSGGTGNWFWWLLIGIGWIILPIRLLAPGTLGENKYGSEPNPSKRTKIGAVICIVLWVVLIGVAGLTGSPR